jgi:LacI family transcriptional regulator
LSSVATGHFESGHRAAQALDCLMKEGTVDGLDLCVDPSEVILRQSTDMLAVGEARIARAIRFIHENACGGITVAQVGRHAGIARTQLERGFRRFFSRSPQAEIRRVQLNRIKQLLVGTDLPLRTIAELCGFVHAEYMIVFFKRTVGESPGRYRRQFHQRFSSPAISGRPPCPVARRVVLR